MNVYLYLLPKHIKRDIFSDCYNALIKRGMSKEAARREVSHTITCMRLLDIDGLIDIGEYIAML